MVERRELITIFRQISSMMEAGVDIRRIIRVLSAQTENPRLLSLYDELDHDLRMGKSLADAMERASDVFSPFAISLVRNSEDPYNTKNAQDLAGTFYRIADFLQKEEEVSPSSQGAGDNRIPITTQPFLSVNAPVLTVNALDGLIDRIQVAALKVLTLTAGLLLSLAAVWWSVEVGLVERRWLAVTLCSVAALFIGGAGVWVRRRLETERKREVRCSFCDQTGEESGAPLKQASRFATTAICIRCTDEFSRQLHTNRSESEPRTVPMHSPVVEDAAEFSSERNQGQTEIQSTPVQSWSVKQTGEPTAETALRALPTQTVSSTATNGGTTGTGATGSGTANGRTPNGCRASQPPADSEATYE